jgi:Holliday junction resolvase
MTHPAKRKGNGYERELVAHFGGYGVPAERAYASNGKALGCAETVDIVAGGCRIQAKRRKKLPAFLCIPNGCDAVVFRQDNGASLVLVRLEDFAAKLPW